MTGKRALEGKDSGHEGKSPLRLGLRGFDLGASLACDAQNHITFLRITVVISAMGITVFTNQGLGSNGCKILHRMEHAI